ncbi:hypothetical protein CVD28_04265 [Bacillus sp. M6-12]|uniref:TraX family protein n=1 Tax=Bacillus sp. M6-12 TaxID=2054166 RepID=UPI000C782F07|nr:TraX family protein [Bacillus sp. M6-12]PLS19639.1 hypothetical protein CVD28_04265 [Bacillus sp. M6-12]
MVKKFDLKNYRLSDSKTKHNEIIKILAILFMIIDHVGFIFYPGVEVLRIIGRLAFPIFAYQIAQGYIHTSNYPKYMWRLWLFAIVSQVPYTLAFDTFRFNTLFTLVIALFLIDKLAKKEYYWIFTIVAIPYFIDVDYGLFGIALPAIFYLTRNKKIVSALLGLIAVLVYIYFHPVFIEVYSIIGILLALYFPTSKIKVKMGKYFFYWFYPAHLALLFVCKMIFLV